MAGWRALCLLLLGSLLEVSLGRRLICWQAMLQCQRETECSYAYRQYTEACSSVLPRLGDPAAAAAHSPTRRRCPSHCISALIQLNHTKGGPALEDCDCAMDDICKATKRAIEPCMPRTSTSTGGGGGGGAAAAAGGGGGAGAGGGAVMGCTEARGLCESDRRCQASLSSYLSHCGRLFNGVRCTDACRTVIADMMRVPKALLLNDCVCDGQDRPICESIKENMAQLCFGEELGNGGPGSSGGSYDDYEEDDYGDEPEPGRDEEGQPKVNPNAGSTGAPGATPPLTLWTCSALMLLVLLLLG